ncbi:MAG TPA: hypothetical protein VII49_04525, partial [Rhizomicrobium sp.]
DAFQWQMSLAALPSDKNPAIEASPFEQAMLAPRAEPPTGLENKPEPEPDHKPISEVPPVEPAPAAAQDNSPAAVVAAASPLAAVPSAPAAESVAVASAPLFRARADLPKDTARDAAKGAPSGIPPVIPILRAPDDPGIDDDAVSDEFAEPLHPAPAQAGGWRGFLARWGG